jgi:chloride channel protein, CIC family
VTAPDPDAVLRSRGYVALLILAAVVGVPVSALAYGFLKLVDVLQNWVFVDVPDAIGDPMWWPVVPLMVAGVLVAAAIRFLPGKGGHSPADGFKAGAPAPTTAELPGVAIAALATLSLGVVLGPEAPLIALGGGAALLIVRLAKPNAPERVGNVVGASGSFAAISTLLGSPLLGAFLLMEATGLAGAMLEVVLLPGLLAAGVGSLVFLGLDSWTGWGTFALSIPDLPDFDRPNLAEFGWALVIGVAGAFASVAVHRLALFLRPRVEPRMLLLMPVIGLFTAGLAIGYEQLTDHDATDVLFSGQSGLGPLVTGASGYTVGALLLLMVCKGLAYGAALSSFRGGPVFPALYLGGAAGIALSHLPGLPLVAGVAMGIGAMSAGMLKLPMTSVLLATLLLASDGVAVMPLVIVAVVVSYVITVRLTPSSDTAAEATAPQ